MYHFQNHLLEIISLASLIISVWICLLVNKDIHDFKQQRNITWIFIQLQEKIYLFLFLEKLGILTIFSLSWCQKMLPYSLALVSSAGDDCENEEELCLPKQKKKSLVIITYYNISIFLWRISIWKNLLFLMRASQIHENFFTYYKQ